MTMNNYNEKEVILNNGVKMPILGFGVYQIPKEDTKQAVLEALKVGYRHIDTAQSYFNEAEVGEAISESGIPREEIFLTTILLHQPFSDYYGAYRALEDAYKAGKARAIGVSNFYPDRLSDIVAFTEIKPQVNQVETHPFNQQIEAQENMIKNNVQLESWASFAEGRNNIFTNPVLMDIAKKYNRSTAQVMIRWQVQRGIVCLTKSVKPERMAENFDVMNFELSADDMARIQSLDTKTSLFFSHQDPATVDFFINLVKERRNK
ncbi:aldo/keto reductase [Veillonella sp.]|uniref:aldo/keto reductase n=1 Tax=Veillonella sp. TaxID=1926307 RepID=UPI0025F00A50|nr:aldo/keto reductase [Veillonella sp.]